MELYVIHIFLLPIFLSFLAFFHWNILANFFRSNRLNWLFKRRLRHPATARFFSLISYTSGGIWPTRIHYSRLLLVYFNFFWWFIFFPLDFRFFLKNNLFSFLSSLIRNNISILSFWFFSSFSLVFNIFIVTFLGFWFRLLNYSLTSSYMNKIFFICDSLLTFFTRFSSRLAYFEMGRKFINRNLKLTILAIFRFFVAEFNMLF